MDDRETSNVRDVSPRAAASALYSGYRSFPEEPRIVPRSDPVAASRWQRANDFQADRFDRLRQAVITLEGQKVAGSAGWNSFIAALHSEARSLVQTAAELNRVTPGRTVRGLSLNKLERPPSHSDAPNDQQPLWHEEGWYTVPGGGTGQGLYKDVITGDYYSAPYLPGAPVYQYERAGSFGIPFNAPTPNQDIDTRLYFGRLMDRMLDKIRKSVRPSWWRSIERDILDNGLPARGPSDPGGGSRFLNELVPGARGFAGVARGGTQRASNWQMPSGRGSDSSGDGGDVSPGGGGSPGSGYDDRPSQNRDPKPKKGDDGQGASTQAPKDKAPEQSRQDVVDKDTRSSQSLVVTYPQKPPPPPPPKPKDDGDGGGGGGDDGPSPGGGDDVGAGHGGDGDADDGGMADPDSGTDDTRPGPRKGQLGPDMTPGRGTGGMFADALQREAGSRIGPMLAARSRDPDPATDRGGNNPHYFRAYEKPNPDDPHPVGPQARSSRSARNPAGYYWKPNPDDPSGGIGPRSYGARAAMSSAASIAAFRAVRSAIVSGTRRGSGG